MRIADHAPAMQASPALQQPASTVHQQQVQAGEMAAAQAAREETRRMTEVNHSEKAEYRPIRGEEQGRNRRKEGGGRKKGAAPSGADAGTTPKGPPCEPGNGNLLDVIV